MNLKNYMVKTFLVFGLFVATCSLGQPLSIAPITVAVQSKAAMIGMQQAVDRGQMEGRISEATGRCISGLSDDSFASVFTRLLAENLTLEEIAVAEAFSGTEAGRRIVKLAHLQLYMGTEKKLPETLLVFTATEIATIEAYQNTSAGTKLMLQRVLESPTSAVAINRRILDLLKACGK